MSYFVRDNRHELRYKGLSARGISVYVDMNGDLWYERKMFKSTFFTNAEVTSAILLMNKASMDHYPREIGNISYALTPTE